MTGKLANKNILPKDVMIKTQLFLLLNFFTLPDSWKPRAWRRAAWKQAEKNHLIASIAFHDKLLSRPGFRTPLSRGKSGITRSGVERGRKDYAFVYQSFFRLLILSQLLFLLFIRGDDFPFILFFLSRILPILIYWEDDSEGRGWKEGKGEAKRIISLLKSNPFFPSLKWPVKWSIGNEKRETG